MSITRHHNEWLSLVPNSGPFLSLPVLTQVFPQGLNAHDPDHARRLRAAFSEWDDSQTGPHPDPTIHRAWTKLVLAETLGFEELLAEGQAIPQTLKSEIAEYGEAIRPDWIVNDPSTQAARLLVQTYPRSQSLNKPLPKSRSNLSPDTRMMQLLRDSGIRLGLVTNGEHWMLVNAPKNETTGYISWYATLWLEEPLTLRAFRTLLCAERFFGVQATETLDLEGGLLDRSAEDQQEVTDQLGYQVRKAVEVLIQALDKADQDQNRKLLVGLDERVLYEAALTVMMRLVFLFCAEERELLLLGDDLYDKNYAVSTLREQLRAAADQFGEEILGRRYDAWTRLLTTFRAVYGGAKHDRLRLPAYGGSLFNPDRFPFLEGRTAGTCWKDTKATPLPISNRTVLHLLEALQMLQVRLPGGGMSEARKLSFSELGIEQIGHVYEGLLDHTAKRATEPMLGLQGTRDKEPEIALAELERLAAKGEKDLLAFIKDETNRSSVNPIKKALAAEIEDQLASRFRTVCQDSELWKRVKPFAGVVRLDTADYPVVITPGSVFVTAGPDRRSSGTHYTPKSLTEPIVEHTLNPLVYFGPAEGLPRSQWRLKTPTEILDLKICDMACGSGAFLVQACRFLAGKLQEAWKEIERAVDRGELKLFEPPPFASAEEKATQPNPRTSPFGFVSEGQLHEQILPASDQDRETLALRLIAQRCLYGVDKNHLAVEMAKLSLWLLTLAKEKPFEFLDHAIRCGDSLIGITTLDQLRHFSLDPEGPKSVRYKGVIKDELGAAVEDRLKIERMPVHSVEDVHRQEELLKQSEERLKPLHHAADLLVAASFWRSTPTDREEWTRHFAVAANQFFDSKAFAELGASARKELRGQLTFHWPLEFPEVMAERGGFDAFIGNPPFMGGRLIGRRLSEEYHDYLEILRDHVKGSPDLCTYFFLRTFSLLRDNGSIGLLATKSISETGNRRVCLDRLLTFGAAITNGTDRVRWPGDASIFVSVVHLYKGAWLGLHLLNGREVAGISGGLTEETHFQEPYKLAAMKGRFSQGQDLMGLGFELTEAEKESLLAEDPRCSDVIRPLFKGEDIANLPTLTPFRWAIYFQRMNEQDARQYGPAFARVERLVKPYRDSLTGQIHEKRFWCYWDFRPRLVAEMKSHDWMLASPRVSKYFAFRRVSTKNIYNEKTKLYFFYNWWEFAVMQSSLHQEWVYSRCGTLGATTITYSTSAALEPWPMPDVALGEALEKCNQLGEAFHSLRDGLMQTNNEGLTDTYNRFHDKSKPDSSISALRDLHSEMDKAVAAVYGWDDLDLGHDFVTQSTGCDSPSLNPPAERSCTDC